MKKLKWILIFSLCSFIVINSAIAQVQQAWVARENGVENKNESGTAIAVDAAGYVYVAGSRSGTADDNNSGFLTIKYNPVNGQVIWAHINDGEGGGNAGPAAIVVDGVGNVYVTGNSGATSDGDKYFTIKYNTSGALQWEASYTNSRSGEYARAIAVDAQGNVFVTGKSDADDGYQSIGTIKYDASGNRKWVRHYHGNSASGLGYGTAIAVDASGNVYVAGVGNYTGTGQDLIILKYDNNGTQLSSNRYDGPGSDEPLAMVLDANANIHITGYSSNFPHGNDILTLKYNSNCNIIWERLYNGPGDKNDRGLDMAVDALGNVFVTGVTDKSVSDADYITLKYDVDGTKLWDVSYDGSPNSNDLALGIALDPSGNVYVTGYSGIGASNTSQINYATIKYNTDGVQQWLKVYDGPDGNYDAGKDIVVDANGNVFVTGVSYSDATKLDAVTIKYTQCALICPVDITVNNDPGQCGAIVNYSLATTTGECGSPIHYSKARGSLFPIGTTIVTVTSVATGAECSFNVTVVDNELPVITCPADKTVNTDAGVCFATAANVHAGNATATDNCSATVVGVRSDGQALTANYGPGITTITWTATDPSGNTAVCTQTITVVDNEPPIISGESASTYVLSPPNHTMRDVTISYTATDNCSVTSALSVTSNEPVNGVSDGDTDPDWIVLDNHHLQLRAERAANGTGRIYTVTITATDGVGNISTKTIEIKVPHNITTPNSGHPFRVGSTVDFGGSFWDKPGNSHTAKWLLDGSNASNGTVTEPANNQNGKVTGSYKFTTAGVYKLQMNITDQNGLTTYTNTNGDLEAILVIYDPNGGYAYGGGYYNSPASALRSNPAATGKASYGFAINYFKNSTYPKGETQFEFKVGDFEFNALNFDYLVISGAKAQFKGTGKITGGQSGVGFIMTVVDGDLDGTGIDKIRMKIFNKNTGAIIYDNQPGASDAANPVLAVSANSSVVINSNSAPPVSTINTQPEIVNRIQIPVKELIVKAMPNPTNNNFTLTIRSNNLKDKIMMQVIDINGRIIEVRNIAAEQTIKLGDRYLPGSYYVRVLQGKEHKEIKLVKLSE